MYGLYGGHTKLPIGAALLLYVKGKHGQKPRTEVLPRKAAVMVASLGSLDVHTGDLEIRQQVADILIEYEVWSDYRAS